MSAGRGAPGLVRKYVRDAEAADVGPVPTQIVASDEFDPLPQTPAQAQVAAVLTEIAATNARRLGLGRRAFLGSSAGMAAAFLAMNRVFGPVFDVHPVEALESAAADARKPASQFVFDVHTHHVAAPRQFENLLQLRRVGRLLNPLLERDRGTMDELYLASYIKEIFLDSDTTVAVLSGIPSATDADNVLPPDQMAETREVVNRLATSQRVLTHGLIAPNKGPRDLDDMRRQAEQLGVSAWKGYTGLPFGASPRPWRVDDEKIAYPMLEVSRRLGIRNICLHKGLPLPGGVEAYFHPRDVERAARDFPDLNFIVYHAGFHSLPPWAAEAGVERYDTSTRVDWVSDLCEIRRRSPRLTNVYVDLGSTFGLLVITAPLLCGHVLGMLVQTFDEDHVLWGTDAIWWGSPQWQIEAFRRFQIPEALRARLGYPPLSAEAKTKILGLNAARLYRVDPQVHRNAVPADFVSRLKAAYLEDGPRPSLTQYGWVPADQR